MRTNEDKQQEIAHLSQKLDELAGEIKGAASEVEVFQKRIEAGEAVEYNTNQLKTAQAGYDHLQRMRADVAAHIERLNAETF